MRLLHEMDLTTSLVSKEELVVSSYKDSIVATLLGLGDIENYVLRLLPKGDL